MPSDKQTESLWSIERVVVVLTPVFTGLSAWLVGWIAQNFPGNPKLDAGQVTALMIAGGLFAVSAVLKWLHGRQIPEIRGTTPAQQAEIATRVDDWMKAHRDELRGPPGLPGPTGLMGPPGIAPATAVTTP